MALHPKAKWPNGESANQVGKTRKAEQQLFFCCRVAGPNLFTVFTVFYAHYAEDHLPKSNGRETIHLSDLSLSGFYDVIHT